MTQKKEYLDDFDTWVKHGFKTTSDYCPNRKQFPMFYKHLLDNYFDEGYLDRHVTYDLKYFLDGIENALDDGDMTKEIAEEIKKELWENVFGGFTYDW